MRDRLRAFDRFLTAHNWVLPAVVLILMLPILIGVAITLGDVSGAQNELHQQQGRIRATVQELDEIQGDQHTEQIEACERGNESRKATIRNLRGDRMNLESDREYIVLELPASPRRDRIVTEKTEAIARKQQAIRHIIASQASVAVAPGSPVVNCEEAYKVSYVP